MESQKMIKGIVVKSVFFVVLSKYIRKKPLRQGQPNNNKTKVKLGEKKASLYYFRMLQDISTVIRIDFD